MFDGKKVILVLGGGGMRGLAHIGVLKVLARNGIVPDEYIGCSGGALVAALGAGGMMPEDIERVGLSLRRKDVLDYNWWSLLWRRGRARSLYRGKAMHDTIRRVLPVDRWDQLQKPLYVNAVDLNSGTETFFGLPGLTDLPIHDAVVASCSIPGVYPPKRIGNRHFVDGGVLDILPIKMAVYNGAGIIIGVNLEGPEETPRGIERKGMVGIIDQSHTIIARTLFRLQLERFREAPLVMIEPHVANHGVFQFERTNEVITAGEHAAERVMLEHPMFRNARRYVDRTPRPEDIRTLPAPAPEAGRTATA
jgi:NTE family protein